MLNQIETITAKRGEAQVLVAAAQAKYNALKNDNARTPAQDLDALNLKEVEEAKDAILKTYVEQYSTAINAVAALQGTVTDNHPSMIAAKVQVANAKKSVDERKADIDAKIEQKINYIFDKQTAKTLDEAQTAYNVAQDQLKADNDLLAKLEKESGKLGEAKIAVDELERQSIEAAKMEDQALEDLKAAELNMISNPTAVFKVEQMAAVSPKSDTRIKVQAGGLVGGLFLGILLSLLVDKFDKRLRDPRDIEPLLGTPLLGTIPRISELKKIKGDQARNLIAEEFRIIRTQILFGNPNLHQKLIAITSPSPGDGKTSLAVNLAISIAKAGRRVLLIDSDLRKPDVHRVFNISDSPGFAEVIQGSHEPGAVIKKTEVDGLEVLPAGTPITRPSELLSRPEIARLLAGSASCTTTSWSTLPRSCRSATRMYWSA